MKDKPYGGPPVHRPVPWSWLGHALWQCCPTLGVRTESGAALGEDTSRTLSGAGHGLDT